MENGNSWRLIQNEDFLESDVWDVMEESRKACEPEQTYTGLLSKQLQSSSAKLIPKAKNSVHEPNLVQHSAPVNIPNWSKIYGKSPNGHSSFGDQGWFDEVGDANDAFDMSNDADDEEEYEYEYEYEDVKDCRLPPHEWLARKQTRNKMSSFSVFEGAGRTLKGRDLTKVRHAVLTRTGFI